VHDFSKRGRISRSNDGFADATVAARRIVLANETRLSVATLSGGGF
jgi:hypothetical protein